jgi:hypothetical protein
VGEFAAMRWAFFKFIKYLVFRHFYALCDCSGLLQFMESILMPFHQCQRWIMDMLRLDYTALHRPEHMMFECNLLSRYNHMAEQLREQGREATAAQDARIEAKLAKGANPNKGTKALAKDSADSLMFQAFATFVARQDMPCGFSNERPWAFGSGTRRTFFAKICDKDRLVMTISYTGVCLMSTALRELNMKEPVVLEGAISDRWIESTNRPSMQKLTRMLQTQDTNTGADWLWMEMDSMPKNLSVPAQQLIIEAKSSGTSAIICCGEMQGKTLS